MRDNWPISKLLPSNADEPMAVQYQVHGKRSADILKFQHHRETLDDLKLASVWWCLWYKNEKTMCLLTMILLVTLTKYPERMGNMIYFILFPKPKQNGAKMSLSNPNEDKNVHFQFSYNFHLFKQNINVILCFSKGSLA